MDIRSIIAYQKYEDKNVERRLFNVYQLHFFLHAEHHSHSMHLEELMSATPTSQLILTPELVDTLQTALS